MDMQKSGSDIISAEIGEYAGPDAESCLPRHRHRPKIMDEPVWCPMVTKTPSPKDPLRHDPRAKAAIQPELADVCAVPT